MELEEDILDKVLKINFGIRAVSVHSISRITFICQNSKVRNKTDSYF
jgi:hypothetical protein